MSRPLNPLMYGRLALIDEATNGQLRKALNDGGLCNWTVCPVCRIDDFVHVEGCKLGDATEAHIRFERELFPDEFAT